MRVKLCCSLLVLSSLFTLPSTVSAHHAFAAEFDRSQPVEFTGTVTKVEWMNPHARFYVNVEEDGDVVNWNLELSSPNVLMRQGWGRDTLQQGDIVTVKGWRARNAPYVANAGDVLQADGTLLFKAPGTN